MVNSKQALNLANENDPAVLAKREEMRLEMEAQMPKRSNPAERNE